MVLQTPTTDLLNAQPAQRVNFKISRRNYAMIALLESTLMQCHESNANYASPARTPLLSEQFHVWLVPQVNFPIQMPLSYVQIV